jgi:hypothetical protein
MEQSRQNIIEGVQKTAANLRSRIQQINPMKSLSEGLGQGQVPGTPLPPGPKNAMGVPVGGSGFVRILMFFIAGILILGVILLAVDQWVTPVFQRSPGAQGYIPIPGTDTTEVFWLKPGDVRDIIVGQPPPSVSVPGSLTQAEPLSTRSIVSQGSYSITMDVLINNEYPHDIGSAEQRTFFVISQTVDRPSLRVGLDNSKNTVYITCFDSEGLQQSVQINNVPIYKPFRIGLVVTPYTLEGYLNGLLVQTKNLKSPSILPTSGDRIFAPNNILTADTPPKSLSADISVQNIRTFGYAASPAEMKARMRDLMTAEDYKMKKNTSWTF